MEFCKICGTPLTTQLEQNECAECGRVVCNDCISLKEGIFVCSRCIRKPVQERAEIKAEELIKIPIVW